MHFSVKTLIEKTAYENGWEVAESDPCPMLGALSSLAYRSSRHGGTLTVGEAESCLLVALSNTATQAKLLQAFHCNSVGGNLMFPYAPPAIADHLPLLSGVFKTAAELELDHQLNYIASDADSSSTERAAEVAQRVGQEIYRKGLLSIWGNCCAVTGLSQISLLRASHARPWADSTDEERLDPYNGLLLAPHLDALFDSGLISFNDEGHILLSPHLTPDTLRILNLTPSLHLRQPLSPYHFPYFEYHRRRVFKDKPSPSI